MGGILLIPIPPLFYIFSTPIYQFFYIGIIVYLCPPLHYYQGQVTAPALHSIIFYEHRDQVYVIEALLYLFFPPQIKQLLWNYMVNTLYPPVVLIGHSFLHVFIYIGMKPISPCSYSFSYQGGGCIGRVIPIQLLLVFLFYPI